MKPYHNITLPKSQAAFELESLKQAYIKSENNALTLRVALMEDIDARFQNAKDQAEFSDDFNVKIYEQISSILHNCRKDYAALGVYIDALFIDTVDKARLLTMLTDMTEAELTFEAVKTTCDERGVILYE